MAPSPITTADPIATRGSARPTARAFETHRRGGALRLIHLALDVWSETRALEAEAYRRHPFTAW